jgi:hypothetical protein
LLAAAARCCLLKVTKNGGRISAHSTPETHKAKEQGIVTLWNNQNAEASRYRIFTITTYSTFPSNLQKNYENDATRANQKTNIPKKHWLR